MENLKQKSKESLVTELKILVDKERKLIAQVLEYLKEVEIRKIYLELGYPSLFEFCIRELGYSEPSAQRRISAMRLIKDIPEIKRKLEEGSLNLTSLNQASLFISQEKRLNNKTYSKFQKQELLSMLENKSKRECERELIKISPNSAAIKEKERMIAEDKLEVRFMITTELKNKLDRIKALISHKNPNPGYEELINELAEMALNKIDPLRKNLPSPAKVKASLNIKVRTRYIPSQIRQMVWKRDEGKCQYQDSKTNQKCSSQYFIQIDHIKPFSQNGSHDPQNLRLLCGQHNRYRYKQENHFDC